MILLLVVVTVSGLWLGNREFLAHWLRGDPVEFAIRTPFGIPGPVYYVVCLVVMAGPILTLMPFVFRRPWLVALITAIGCAPITYSALTPGC